MKLKAELYDENALNRTIKRIAHEIIEHTPELENVCLIGIKTRGVPIARRLSEFIKEIENVDISVGVLDVTLYRDDFSGENDTKASYQSSINFETTGRNAILVDDVIYTGRTARAAMDALLSFGRPSKIQLAVLIDRGHRELPIRPDYVGKNIPTSRNEVIKVMLRESDGADRVELYQK